MSTTPTCLVLSMNLLNWGMYGPVAPAKVRAVVDVVRASRPLVLCLSEVGPDDAVAQLTGPLSEQGLIYEVASVGTSNKRGIRNAILTLRGVEVLEPKLAMPLELTIPPIDLESFQMGGMRLRLSREPLGVLVRAHGLVVAVGFFHPKSKYLEDFRNGDGVSQAPHQTFLGLCKMMSSLRNFGQCMLAREFVDRFSELNPTKAEWGVSEGDIRFVLAGDWNANPQEEQRQALGGYVDGGLTAETLLHDVIGGLSTDLDQVCTIRWAGNPSSFDAIYVDARTREHTFARIVPVDLVDLFGLPPEERDRVENETLDHCPVGLFLE